LAALLLLMGLAACGKVDPQGVEKAAADMTAAALKSSLEELYYYKETRFAVRDDAGKVVTPTRYTELNLLAATDIDGKHLYDTVGGGTVSTKDENGVPVTRYAPERQVLRDYKIKLYRKVDNRSDIQFISGLSNGNTDTTFFWQWDEHDKATLIRYDAAREEFVSSALFAPFSLRAKVAELADLKPEEMDFSGKKAKLKRNGELVALSFAVKPEYFTRIGGKTSVLRDSTRVEVEFSYGRIQLISVFRASDSWLKEEEAYTIKIVYKGPSVDVPDYTSKDWKDIGATADLPGAI
jgi:hypothetical protein